VCGVFHEANALKYPKIKEMRQVFPVRMMCTTLGVSESGYHAWCSRSPLLGAQEEGRLRAEIAAAHVAPARLTAIRTIASGFTRLWRESGYAQNQAHPQNAWFALQAKAQIWGDDKLEPCLSG